MCYRECTIYLRSQFATSDIETERASSKGGRRYLPYAFTEQEIAMLSMRRFMAENAMMFDKLNSLELKQVEYQKESNEKFDQIFAYISEHEEVRQKIFFEGQIYDAFSLLVSLVEKAEKSIVV